MRRRRMLALLGAAAAGGCASPPSPPASQPRTLAPGVYLLPGSGGTADAHNLGRIANAGFIVGERGVLVVDTGTSFAHGRAILAAVRSVTDKPVKLALVTHARPEFLFGGPAFQDAGIPVRMHDRAAQLMAARCDGCLKQLRQTVGAVGMAGTAMYRPDQVFGAAHTVEGLGRAVRVLYFGHASGPGDVAVLDEASGTLFAGGLLDAARVPDIQDGELPAWHRALASLRGERLTTIVPGHGAPGSPALIDAVDAYLAALETRMRALVEAGASLIDLPAAGELPAYAHWDQYETIHRRNASTAFLRAEREWMFRQPREGRP
ncbi:MBL fold metallo-hydrolase [Piscinibacter sp.]|uniref:MBL fold metallo-hydrolase n=1 Tax=Piscinibacter sp. TaxID=1903157 RepID=UPI0039E70AC4